jgi:hypothetical protein
MASTTLSSGPYLPQQGQRRASTLWPVLPLSRLHHRQIIGLQLCRTLLDEWANQNSVIDSKRQRLRCLRPAVLRGDAKGVDMKADNDYRPSFWKVSGLVGCQGHHRQIRFGILLVINMLHLLWGRANLCLPIHPRMEMKLCQYFKDGVVNQPDGGRGGGLRVGIVRGVGIVRCSEQLCGGEQLGGGTSPVRGIETKKIGGQTIAPA